jgi:hypothetical protein
MQGVRTPDSAEHETGLAVDEGQKFRTIPCGGNDSQRLCPLGSHKKCPSVPSPTDGLFHAYSGDEQIFEHVENKPPDMEGTMTFKPGVSGNPHGNRHRTRHLLNQEFMQALLLNFRHEGKRAIEKVARNQPGVYLKILALLVPRELKVEQSQGVKAMSDEQLEQAIEALQAMLEQQAKVIEHTTETIALPAPDVVPDGPNKVMDAADTAVGTRERKLRKGRVSSLSGG